MGLRKAKNPSIIILLSLHFYIKFSQFCYFAFCCENEGRYETLEIPNSITINTLYNGFILKCFSFFQFLSFIVFDPFVDLFITLCILVNTLFMALDQHDMDPSLNDALRNGNYVRFFSFFYLSVHPIGKVQLDHFCTYNSRFGLAHNHTLPTILLVLKGEVVVCCLDGPFAKNDGLEMRLLINQIYCIYA